MNERIRKLAEQAGFSFKYKTAPDELNPGHELQDLEKFAELIIRECALVVHKKTGPKSALNVLEHFGVEE